MRAAYLLSTLLLAGLAATGHAQTVNINCGGLAFTATDGTQWTADQDYTDGDLLYTGQSIVGVAAQDLNLYRSGRAGLYTDFSYNIPVPNGSYTVTLGFAEIQYLAPRQRVFNVVLNGTTVLSNFDILTHVAPLTPYTQQFPVAVTDGAVRIAVNGVTGRGLLNAIQVAPYTAPKPPAPTRAPVLSLGSTALQFSGTAGAADPAPKTVAITNAGAGSLTWNTTSNSAWLTVSPSTGTGAGTISLQPSLSGLSAGTYSGSVSVSAAGASGSPATVAVTLTVAAAPPPVTAPPPSQSSIHINCGGYAWTTADGTHWSADVDYTDGEVRYASSAITATSAQDYYLYRTARDGLWSDFSYSIPAPNGSYTVSLHFAEIQYSAKGKRVFNVVLNGNTVLSNFDILASVAPLTPLVKQFPVTVSDGAVHLAFNGVVNRGIINAIEVTPATGQTALPPTLVLGGTSMSFAGTAGGADPTAKALNVTNGGGGTLNWTASSNAAWLAVSPASGAAPASISVEPKLSGLAAGNYTATITVTAPGAASAPQTVSVALSVTAGNPPVLTLSPSSLSFSAAAGGSNPSTQTVTISNSGGGTLSWTASADQSWLTISPASGSDSGTLTIGANLGSLAANIYSATLTVNAGSGGTKAIPVNFSVAPAATAGGGGTVPLPGGNGNSWYVSTSGTPTGDGSMARPWDLQTALNQPASVKPGDTIWIHGGRYGGGQASSVVNSNLVGTPALPIIVRAYPGERVTVDAWLQVGCCDGANDPARGSYTWFWGLEFAGFNTDRSSGTSGPPEWAAMSNHAATDAWGDGTRYINCIFHDTSGGISIWDTANSEAYGNIIYNVGGYGTDRGHGHLLYIQNDAPSVLKVTDNIGFNNFDEGVQAYGSSTANVQNIVFTGNIIFNSGLLYGNLVDNFTIGGGATGPDNITLDSNYTYDTPSRKMGQNELGFLWTPSAGSATVTNNYFIGGAQAVDLERWHNLTFRGNTMYTVAGTQPTWLIYTADEDPAGYNDANNTYYGSGQFWLFPNCSNWPCATERTIGSAQWQGMGLDKGSVFSSNDPTGVWTFVRPNQYEAGRANIVIYNWDLNPSVSVDLSNSGIKIGDSYQIRDAENWYNGAVATGTYDGSPVSIPMSGLVVAPPVGSVPYPPSHTAPQFGAFVLLSGTALANAF